MHLGINSVQYRVGDLRIISSATAEARRGAIVGIVGPNGSGKSTLANLIAGTLRPTFGEILLNSRAITNLSPWQIAQHGVSRMFQDQHLAWNLSTMENILAVADAISGPSFSHCILRAMSTDSARFSPKGASILQRLGLIKQEHVLARDLSYGQQRLLAFARAVLRRNTLVILDEPFTGIHMDLVSKLLRLIQDEKATRIWLIIDHNLRHLREVADQFWYLHGGILTQFRDYGVMENSDVFQQSYLGFQTKHIKRRTVVISSAERGDQPISSRAKLVSTPSVQQLSDVKPLLSVKNFSAGYGRRRVVENVNFDLASGQVFCIIGPNGSGKSTLLRAIVGLPQHIDGDVLVRGNSIVKMSPDERVRIGIRMLLQEGRVMRSLSVRENLSLSAAGLTSTAISFRGVPLCASTHTRIATASAEGRFFHKARTSRPYQKAGVLSGGEQAKLALAGLQIGHSEILLLDEPATGVDGIARFALVRFIKVAARRGAAIIIVEHDLEFVASVASKIAVLADSALEEIPYNQDASVEQIATIVKAKSLH